MRSSIKSFTDWRIATTFTVFLIAACGSASTVTYTPTAARKTFVLA